MLADVLEVSTSSVFSPRNDSRGRLVRIERLGGMAFFRDQERAASGTTVRIRLRPDIGVRYRIFAREAAAYLRWLVLRPPFLIHVALGPGDLTFYLPSTQGLFFEVSREGRELYEARGYEVITVELERWSDRLWGVVIVVLSRDSEGYLGATRNGSSVVFKTGDPEQLDPLALVPTFQGNRLTVGGFRVKTFRTKNLLRFRGEQPVRFPFLIDAEAAGGPDVEFDVSRERLTRKGEMFPKRRW